MISMFRKIKKPTINVPLSMSLRSYNLVRDKEGVLEELLYDDKVNLAAVLTGWTQLYAQLGEDSWRLFPKKLSMVQANDDELKFTLGRHSATVKGYVGEWLPQLDNPVVENATMIHIHKRKNPAVSSAWFHFRIEGVEYRPIFSIWSKNLVFLCSKKDLPEEESFSYSPHETTIFLIDKASMQEEEVFLNPDNHYDSRIWDRIISLHKQGELSDEDFGKEVRSLLCYIQS